ncbi:MAG: hypothetical protein K2Q34_08570 [Alphaproteobacteria bacterium]|nr:hypothetical protein [Alphaproteobacteria bacterium]
MDKLTKRKTLIDQVNSILNNPYHKNELDGLRKKLHLATKEIVEAYVLYDLDVSSYGNEIYELDAIRFVLHLHNLLSGSWHIERQAAISSLLKKKSNSSSILDVGFGVPTQYIREALKEKKRIITLCDISQTAIDFARDLLGLWSPIWTDTIRFIKEDMNNVKKLVGDHDLYIFQDSIEHSNQPTECLKQFVKLSSSHSSFILSLPIGPLIPMHYISWDTINDAEKWVNLCGLKITDSFQVKTKKGIDLFAEELDGYFLNYVILCTKQNVKKV